MSKWLQISNKYELRDRWSEFAGKDAVRLHWGGVDMEDAFQVVLCAKSCGVRAPDGTHQMIIITSGLEEVVEFIERCEYEYTQRLLQSCQLYWIDCHNIDDLKADWKQMLKQSRVELIWTGGIQCICKISLDFANSLCIVEMDNTRNVVQLVKQSKRFEHKITTLADVVHFLESCFVAFGKALVYCAMQNMIPLLKDNNGYNIKADLTDEKAVISCDFENRPSATYTISSHAQSLSQVDICEQQLQCGCCELNICVYPNDTKKIQEDMFGPLPNNQACKNFWEDLTPCNLAHEFEFSIKEDRGLYWKSFWVVKQFEEDHESQTWVEITLCDTGRRFSLKICFNMFYGGVISYLIPNARWTDIARVEKIAADLKAKDIRNAS